MIVIETKTYRAKKAAQHIIWRHGARWLTEDLTVLGVDEAQLTDSERIELLEQLHLQDRRIRALFGI